MHIYYYYVYRERGEDLARPVFDVNVTILSNGTSLLWEGLGSPGVGLRLEVMLLVRHFSPSLQISFRKNEDDRKKTERNGRELGGVFLVFNWGSK